MNFTDICVSTPVQVTSTTIFLHTHTLIYSRVLVREYKDLSRYPNSTILIPHPYIPCTYQMADDYAYDMAAEGTKVIDYDQEMPQSHTTDQPVAPPSGVA